MDNLDFLDGAPAPKDEAQPQAPTEPQADAPQAEPQAAEPPAIDGKAAQPRGPDGKFARKEADDPIMVPIAALHETRDKVRDLEARLSAIQPPPQQAPHQVPDIFADPEGFVQYQNNQLQAATLNTTLNISEEMTRASAGQETVDEAQKWGAQAFAQNPAFYQQFIQQRNPYGFLVEHYKRATTFAKLGDDPAQIEAFLAWKQAQAPTPPAQATPQQPTPPPSIAAAPSAGGMQRIASGPGAAFDSFIK